MVVKTFISESTIKAFDIGILRGLAWLDERQPYPASMSPCIECQAGEFGPMIDPDHLGQRAQPCNAIQYTRHALSRNRSIDLGDDAFLGEVINWRWPFSSISKSDV
ncbi:hypothetical protein NNRS527_02199 [Nitrosospira sp. NRS527]|nr:hypothetical protein NNRS527_02199 [Nitrosospira sp. NRS527]